MNSNGNVGVLRRFDLRTIEVGGTVPIQVWFRKTDGSVWGYSNLPVGVWDVSGAAAGIVAVWISGAPGQVNEGFRINSFSIRTY